MVLKLKVIKSTGELKNFKKAGRWWHMPLIPALGRQRQADPCEFQVNLIYRASSRTGSKAAEKTCLETNKQANKRIQVQASASRQ